MCKGPKEGMDQTRWDKNPSGTLTWKPRPREGGQPKAAARMWCSRLGTSAPYPQRGFVRAAAERPSRGGGLGAA